MKFISNKKNPYESRYINEEKELQKGEFVSKKSAKTMTPYRDNTSNLCGRKVTFKHV